MVITMSNKFWLIQRGKIRPTFEPATEFLSGRQDAMVNPAYMGASEFEWGAIPNAYVRLLAMMSEYKDDLQQVIQVTDLKNVKDKTLWLVCDPARREKILDAIKEYIQNPYGLKEYSHLSEHFSPEKVSYRSWALKETDFWWCIDRVSCMHPDDFYGDWVAFIGGPARAAKLSQIFEKDLRTSWLSLDEATRVEKLNKASRR